jgi:hypothetical protein
MGSSTPPNATDTQKTANTKANSLNVTIVTIFAIITGSVIDHNDDVRHQPPQSAGTSTLTPTNPFFFVPLPSFWETAADISLNCCRDTTCVFAFITAETETEDGTLGPGELCEIFGLCTVRRAEGDNAAAALISDRAAVERCVAIADAVALLAVMEASCAIASS